jgi:futalosine hydrolase
MTSSKIRRHRNSGLIVSATRKEVAPLFDHALQVLTTDADNLFTLVYPTREWELLITGVGIANTAYHLGLRLNQKRRYKAVIQVGIAGAWDRNLPIGSVVAVTTDCFSEMGVMTPDHFLTMEQMGFPLLETNSEKFYNIIHNPNSLPQLNSVQGITVNSVHSCENYAKQTRDIWTGYGYDFQVESMEGAAFLLACHHRKQPIFHQIRSISNYVENRDLSQWNIPLAVENLGRYLLKEVLETEWK